MTDFLDLPHLRQLQNDLWRWPRERASVMVGAGLKLVQSTPINPMLVESISHRKKRIKTSAHEKMSKMRKDRAG
jgi:hypothetical protein